MGPILSPDGTRIAFGMGGIRVDSPPELCVMDAITGQKLAAMKGVSRWTHSIAFSSDGKRLAAFVPDVDPMGVNRDADTPANRLVGKILIWDAETGRQVRAIPDVKGHMPRPAFSPDGTRIAIVLQQTPVGFESEVKVWDIATGKSVLALPVPLGGAVSTTSVAFSPDGKALAAVGPASSTRNELHVWDTASGRPRFAIQGPFRWYYVQLAFSPDSTRITCAGGDSRVGLWDAASGKELAMYRGHTANVCAVAFSRDGRQLLSADAVDSVKVWDAHPRADALVLNPGGVLMYTALSRDAQRIATIVSRPKTGDEVKVWNQAGIQLLSLKLSTPRAELFANTDRAEFSRNGDRVAYVTNWSGNPLSDKVQSGLTVWDGAGKELLNLVKEGVGFSFFAVALSPDGKRVAAAVITGNLNTAPGKSMVRVWEIATGKQLLTTQPTNGFFSAIAFSPDGTRLATIGGGLSASSQILVLDAATGSECARWLGPPGITGSIDFSPDGRKVAATVGDYRHQGELVVGDMASGELIKLGRAQGTVVFSPDGTRLAAHSALIPHPAEVSLWDVATGRQLLVLKGHAGMSAQDGIAFSPSGDRIVSTATLQGTHAVEVRTWDAATLPLPEPTK